MKELPLNSRIEIEIHRLLNSQANLVDVIDELTKKYIEIPLSLPELETLSTFFLYSGFYVELNAFLLHQLIEDKKIPWGHFYESVILSAKDCDSKIKQAVVDGATSQDLLEELSRTFMLDLEYQVIPEARNKKNQLNQKRDQERCDEMFNNLAVLKAQGLFEEEANLLDKVLRLYPSDPRNLDLLTQRKKREVLGLLEKQEGYKPSWIPLDAYLQPSKEERQILKTIEKSMFVQLGSKEVDEILAKDFAIAHAMWDNDDAALNFLDPLSHDRSTLWLRFELLLRCRKFVELLSELEKAQQNWVNDPDITYHLLYLRALSFWGLGKTTEAIELMESISISRPGYRSSLTLLAEWKQKSP